MISSKRFGIIVKLVSFLLVANASFMACKSRGSSKGKQISAREAAEREGRDFDAERNSDASITTRNSSCAQEFALLCDPGKIDACLLGTGARDHVCVPRPDFSDDGDCKQEFALLCPEGQMDACLIREFKGARDHKCVAKPRNLDTLHSTASRNSGLQPESSSELEPCSREFALICPEGQVDECLTTISGNHQCIPAKPVQSQGKCSQEFALVCSNGEVDACFSYPNNSTGHYCMAVSGSRCSTDSFPICPDGQVDACRVVGNVPSIKLGHHCIYLEKGDKLIN